MVTISVTVITKNEAANIRRCLESVKWADEIIIFDSGSTDETLQICKLYTDKIWQTDWPGYGKQKQRALEQTTCDWVLSIDADEVVTEKLRQEIQQAIQKNDCNGYKLIRDLVFHGKRIRFANATNKILRLVRRDKAYFTSDMVHESLVVDGSIEILKGVLLHYSLSSATEMLKKMNYYTDISAQQKLKKGKRGGVWCGVLKALWMFFRVYVLNGGFMDGRAGLVLAVGFAEGAFYRYVKLYYLRGGK